MLVLKRHDKYEASGHRQQEIFLHIADVGTIRVVLVHAERGWAKIGIDDQAHICQVHRGDMKKGAA